MAALWLALHCPRLALDAAWPQRLRPGLPAELAVQEHNLICQATPAAGRAGVAAGMRVAAAQSRLPSLLLAGRQQARERELAEAVAMAMQAVTPQVAWLADDLLLLEVGGSLRLFGGVRRLLAQVRQGLLGLPLEVVQALAPTARGAALLARARRGRRRVLRHATLRRELDRLPWRWLPEAQPHAEWLDSLGCRTLGGLGRLPVAGLRRRAGEALTQALEQAYGTRALPLAWWQPPANFRQRLEPFYPLLDVTQVNEVATLLLRQMCAWLSGRHGRVARCVLEFHYEQGRLACPPDSLPVVLAEPDWQFDTWWRVLAEALQRQALPAPVVALELVAGPVLARPAPRATLFADPADDTDNLALLDLLVARLGAQAILQPAPQADYRPERANGWAPVAEAPHGLAETPRGLPARRPPWLLDPPQPLAMQEGRPAWEGGPLRLVSGPERLETGWWDGGLQARDYFVAQDAQGCQCWIFRERGAGAGTAAGSHQAGGPAAEGVVAGGLHGEQGAIGAVSRQAAPGGQNAIAHREATVWWLHGWFG